MDWRRRRQRPWFIPTLDPHEEAARLRTLKSRFDVARAAGEKALKQGDHKTFTRAVEIEGRLIEKMAVQRTKRP